MFYFSRDRISGKLLHDSSAVMVGVTSDLYACPLYDSSFMIVIWMWDSFNFEHTMLGLFVWWLIPFTEECNISLFLFFEVGCIQGTPRIRKQNIRFNMNTLSINKCVQLLLSYQRDILVVTCMYKCLLSLKCRINT